MSAFISSCTSLKVFSPPEKIVKNLCTFLCQDVDETPAFALVMQQEKGIITVKSILSSDSNSANGRGKGSRPEPLSEESTKAKVSRRGAELAFQQLSREFGEKLFDLVPKIWEFMAGGLLNAFASGELTYSLILHALLKRCRIQTRYEMGIKQWKSSSDKT